MMDGELKQRWDPLNVIQSSDVENCYWAWKWYVEQYSGCGLSHSEDKLVALAGIARQIGQALQTCHQEDEYVAGLWRTQLLSQLLWKYSHGSSSGKRSASYRAPSWSWASVDGQVSFLGAGDAQDVCHAMLMSATTTTFTDPFGAVSSAFIRICGPLFRAQLDLDKSTLAVGLQKDAPRCGICLDDDFRTEACYILDVHILLVRANKGLLLQPTASDDSDPEISHGSFVRLGTFSMNGKKIRHITEVVSLVQDPLLVYEQYNGSGRYTIKII